MNYVFFLLVICTLGSSAQTVHELPFAAQNATLELAIENFGTSDLEGVTITTMDAPSWLRFVPDTRTIGQVGGNKTATARFSLSVEPSAPIGQEHRVSMTVLAATGMSWKKELLISVAPPTTFELFQNFPNPFNPSTTIAYQLPGESNVSIKVFDLLGREVAILANGQQRAGHHDVSWDASRQSSGMYVYELVAEPPGEKQVVIRRTMMLVK